MRNQGSHAIDIPTVANPRLAQIRFPSRNSLIGQPKSQICVRDSPAMSQLSLVHGREKQRVTPLPKKRVPIFAPEQRHRRHRGLPDRIHLQICPIKCRARRGELFGRVIPQSQKQKPVAIPRPSA